MDRATFVKLVGTGAIALSAAPTKALASLGAPKTVGNEFFDTIAGKCLVRDYLPKNASARYTKDPSKAVTLMSLPRNEVSFLIEGSDFLLPIFSLEKYPHIDVDEVFINLIDSSVIDWGTAFDENYSHHHIITSKNLGYVNDDVPKIMAFLNAGFAKIEHHRLTISKLLVGKKVRQQLESTEMHKYYDFVSDDERQLTKNPNLIGRLWTADIYDVSKYAADNVAYLLAPAEYVGVMPIRSEKELGLAIMNPAALSKIIV